MVRENSTLRRQPSQEGDKGKVEEENERMPLEIRVGSLTKRIEIWKRQNIFTFSLLKVGKA